MYFIFRVFGGCGWGWIGWSSRGWCLWGDRDYPHILAILFFIWRVTWSPHGTLWKRTCYTLCGTSSVKIWCSNFSWRKVRKKAALLWSLWIFFIYGSTWIRISRCSNFLIVFLRRTSEEVLRIAENTGTFLIFTWHFTIFSNRSSWVHLWNVCL